MYICFTTKSQMLIALLQIAALYNIQLTEQIADT